MIFHYLVWLSYTVSGHQIILSCSRLPLITLYGWPGFCQLFQQSVSKINVLRDNIAMTLEIAVQFVRFTRSQKIFCYMDNFFYLYIIFERVLCMYGQKNVHKQEIFSQRHSNQRVKFDKTMHIFCLFFNITDKRVLLIIFFNFIRTAYSKG